MHRGTTFGFSDLNTYIGGMILRQRWNAMTRTLAHPERTRNTMAKKPNYGQERRDRDRIKAAKKAEKANAKASKSASKPDEVNEQETKQE